MTPTRGSPDEPPPRPRPRPPNSAASLAAMTTHPSINLPRQLLLWPDRRTPRRSPADGDLPRLTYYLPSDEFRSGQSVLILPGGGYQLVSSPKEGHRPAQLLAARGIAAGVLEYRHAPQRHPVPLLDAQRAMRWMRAESIAHGLDPGRVGCMGFSAGGHLAGCLAMLPDLAESAIDDEVGRQPCHPDFALMIYAVVTMVESFANQASPRNLLGDNPQPRQLAELSLERAAHPGCPPFFIAHGRDDTVVPVRNALALYSALLECGVPATMHLYQDFSHGVGLAANHPWGQAMLDWLGCR